MGSGSRLGALPGAGGSVVLHAGDEPCARPGGSTMDDRATPRLRIDVALTRPSRIRTAVWSTEAVRGHFRTLAHSRELHVNGERTKVDQPRGCWLKPASIEVERAK